MTCLTSLPRALRAARRCSPIALAAALGAAQAANHTWTSGAFAPGVTAPNPLPAADTLFASGVGSKDINAITLDNDGRIEWTGAGSLRLLGGGTLINDGVIERIGTAGSASMTTGTGGGTFTNNGWVINTGAGVSLALDGGTLVNNGTFDNRGAIFALPGSWTNTGTLMGVSYQIGGTGLVNAGILAPGSSGVGSMELTNSNSFAQTSAGTLAIDITSATAFDFLDVRGQGFGDATLAGTLALNCFGACSLAVGDEITVLRALRSITGRFDRVTLNGFATGAFDVIYEINPGVANDFVRLRVTQAVSAVPEPATLALVLLGLGGVAAAARRQHQRG